MSKAAKRERQRQNRIARREVEAQIARRRRTFKTMRGFGFVVLPIAAIFLVISIAGGSDDTSASGGCTDISLPKGKDGSLTAPTQNLDPTLSYTATIKTTCGTIEIALATQQAPISTNNFVSLAQKGFYDDLAFGRAAKNFVIQTGSPSQDQNGDAGYTVVGEIPNSSPAYPVGTVAFAKGGAEPTGTAGSQFFIVTGSKNSTLPADYALIGTVTKGLDIAKRITGFAPDIGDGIPTRIVVMKSVKITTAPSTTATTTTSTTVAP